MRKFNICLIILIVISCSGCFKGCNSMSDKVYAKITFRVTHGYGFSLFPVPPKDSQGGELLNEICLKYNYNYEDWVDKNSKLMNDFSSLMTLPQYNLILQEEWTRITIHESQPPQTDEEWTAFFNRVNL